MIRVDRSGWPCAPAVACGALARAWPTRIWAGWSIAAQVAPTSRSTSRPRPTSPAELARALTRPVPHGRGGAAAAHATLVVEDRRRGGRQAASTSSTDDDDARARRRTATYHARLRTTPPTTAARSRSSGGTLYLRPRYQRWHGRAPETADEPAALRDELFARDRRAPGTCSRRPPSSPTRARRQVAGPDRSQDRGQAAPTPRQAGARDRHPAQVARARAPSTSCRRRGRPRRRDRRAAVGAARGHRRVRARRPAVQDAGDADRGARRDRHRGRDRGPAEGEVVATPERLREVDERDYLLQGIAPPIRKNPDGTAVPPVPAAPARRSAHHPAPATETGAAPTKAPATKGEPG